MAQSQKIPQNKKRTSLSAPCLFTLRIELKPNEIQPVIWRRLEVDGRISLSKLHHFIQASFGWTDAHLHEFEIQGRTFAIPDPEDEMYGRIIEDERKVFLRRLLATEDVFLYRYDFGDNWEHDITVESFIDNMEHDPRGGALITDGARACPPEDVGGSNGYHEFLEGLLVDPYLDEAQRHWDWAGGNFDPLQFDKRIANAAILRMLYNGWGSK